MKSRKSTYLSALTPSNRVTLGNYLGALKNWVEFSKNEDCIFFVVDLHAITDQPDPKKLKELTYSAVATYLACGLDPNKSTLFVQSHVPAHAELQWVLTCHSTMGELSRMTQFKEKSQKHGESIPAGLFQYPVLMAADILLYQTSHVPVGADQKQHVELTRNLAIRLNKLYGEDLFRVPEPWIPKAGGKIMSLQDPTKKMSKSDPDPLGALYLDDTPAEIEKKIKRSVTDSLGVIQISDEQPGVFNLLTIQALLEDCSPEDLLARYSGQQYGHLKLGVLEAVQSHLNPIRAKIQGYLADKGEIDRILREGARKAQERATPTLKKLYDRLGFISVH